MASLSSWPKKECGSSSSDSSSSPPLSTLPSSSFAPFRLLDTPIPISSTKELSGSATVSTPATETKIPDNDVAEIAKMLDGLTMDGSEEAYLTRVRIGHTLRLIDSANLREKVEADRKHRAEHPPLPEKDDDDDDDLPDLEDSSKPIPEETATMEEGDDSGQPHLVGGQPHLVSYSRTDGKPFTLKEIKAIRAMGESKAKHQTEDAKLYDDNDDTDMKAVSGSVKPFTDEDFAAHERRWIRWQHGPMQIPYDRGNDENGEPFTRDGFISRYRQTIKEKPKTCVPIKTPDCTDPRHGTDQCGGYTGGPKTEILTMTPRRFGHDAMLQMGEAVKAKMEFDKKTHKRVVLPSTALTEDTVVPPKSKPKARRKYFKDLPRYYFKGGDGHSAETAIEIDQQMHIEAWGAQNDLFPVDILPCVIKEKNYWTCGVPEPRWPKDSPEPAPKRRYYFVMSKRAADHIAKVIKAPAEHKDFMKKHGIDDMKLPVIDLCFICKANLHFTEVVSKKKSTLKETKMETKKKEEKPFTCPCNQAAWCDFPCALRGQSDHERACHLWQDSRESMVKFMQKASVVYQRRESEGKKILKIEGDAGSSEYSIETLTAWKKTSFMTGAIVEACIHAAHNWEFMVGLLTAEERAIAVGVLKTHPDLSLPVAIIMLSADDYKKFAATAFSPIPETKTMGPSPPPPTVVSVVPFPLGQGWYERYPGRSKCGLCHLVLYDFKLPRATRSVDGRFIYLQVDACSNKHLRVKYKTALSSDPFESGFLTLDPSKPAHEALVARLPPFNPRSEDDEEKKL